MMKKLVFGLIALLCFLLIGCKEKQVNEKPCNMSVESKASLESKQNVDMISQEQDELADSNTQSTKELIDSKDIERIVFTFNIYSSVKLFIEQNEEIELITNILNTDKTQIFNNIEFSYYDVSLFIDIIYKERDITIKILSDDDIYYFIDDVGYICTKTNHNLLVDFISQKCTEIIPKTNFPFIEVK